MLELAKAIGKTLDSVELPETRVADIAVLVQAGAAKQYRRVHREREALRRLAIVRRF